MDDYLDNFFESDSMGLGGQRPNSGRKSRDVERDADYANYGKARARKEAALAGQEEIELAKQAGEIVARESVRDATATAYATIAQSLRAIPDNLERQMGIQPEVAERIGQMIDEAMADLAEELRKIHEENAGAD